MQDKHAVRKHELREEIKRITNVTLRCDFRNPDDRKYWENRVRKLNCELSSIEQMRE